LTNIHNIERTTMPAKHPDEVGRETFVVVPAYNEARVIGDVVRGLLTTFPNVVVVDDGSSDDTAAILKGLPVTVVTHYVNLGQGAALQTGIKHALERGASYIVTFDADGQHRIEDALAAVHMLSEGGCDAVCGSRFLGTTSNVPRTRKILLKAAVRLANLTTGTRMTDAHNGLRALSRKAAACLDLSQSGMAHASEIISQLRQHNMLIREVPVRIDYTEYSLAKGQSSLNSINILLDLVIGRFLK
jgi:glycosyltransferase involved in cell wall biosynthesis